MGCVRNNGAGPRVSTPGTGQRKEKTWGNHKRGLREEGLKGNKHTHTCMFRAVLVIIAKTWKSPRAPLAGEWINKLWYIQIMEYYSVLRKSYQTIKIYGRYLNVYYSIKAILKMNLLYDSNYTTFWKRHNHGDRR